MWLSNGFWGPMRELQRQINTTLPFIPPDYQPVMERVLDGVERRDAAAAEAELSAFYKRVDATLLEALSSHASARHGAAAGDPTYDLHPEPWSRAMTSIVIPLAALSPSAAPSRSPSSARRLLGYPPKCLPSAKMLSRKEQAIVGASDGRVLPRGRAHPRVRERRGARRVHGTTTSVA